MAFLRKKHNLFYILIVVIEVFVYSSCEFDSSSGWEPFCRDDLYYKPYVRIRQGRNGQLLRDLGPGFISLRGMEDLYICANGLIFFYYKLVKTQGGVYDDAVMQFAPHFCGFFNGKLGPGTEGRHKTLEAILLIGHPEDYRKVSLQMFVAPLYMDSTNSTLNLTSLVIINTDGECLIEKGPERARIRIRANPVDFVTPVIYAPDDERHVSFCRLDATTNMGQDPGKIPLEKDSASAEEIMEALTFDSGKPLKFVGCFSYPILNQQQLEIIERKTEELKNDSYFVDKTNSELNPEDSSKLTFWTTERIDKYGSPLLDPDADALSKDVPVKENTYLAATKDTPPEPAKIASAKQEFDIASMKFGLVSYIQQYKEMFELVRKYGDKAKVDWDIAWDAVKDDTIKNAIADYNKALSDISEFTHERRYEPYNFELVDKIEAAKKASEEAFAILKENTLKAAPLITKAEVNYYRHKDFMGQLRKRMQVLQQHITNFEQRHKIVTGFQEEPEQFEDTLVSIKNEGPVTDACTTLERRQDQCKNVKPSPARACQLAKNMLGKGSKDWSVADNSWREDVFEVVENIFVKVCPYLPADFAFGINAIVRGYLMEEPKGTGQDNSPAGSPYVESTLKNYMTNYKMTKPDEIYPELKPKDPIWEDIIKALEECEKEAGDKFLKFEYSSMRPPRFTFQGEEIPSNVEQADKEFSFNWAVDMNHKMFSTVLGHCWGKLEASSPSLPKKFHERYTEDFFDPIRPIWLSNRDNSIFRVILGKHYVSGKGHLWTSLCMESSFVQSGQKHMRPLRKLYVNSYSELNFFSDGPLKGTRGEYA